MKRGDFYQVYKGNKYDPKNHRIFMIVSRQAIIDSIFSSVICAPVYSKYDDITTQVEVGVEEGLKHTPFLAYNGF
jgi:mRNA interferase MazF